MGELLANWTIFPKSGPNRPRRSIVGQPPVLPAAFEQSRSKLAKFYPGTGFLFTNPEAELSVPNAISDLALGTVTSSTVPLTWTAPGDGGAAITDYEVRYTVGGVPHAVVLTGSTATSFTIGGGGGTPASTALPASTAITAIDVRAVNSVGTAASSNVLSTTTSAPVSSAIPMYFIARNGLTERDIWTWSGGTITNVTNQTLVGINSNSIGSYVVNGTKTYITITDASNLYIYELTNDASPVLKYTAVSGTRADYLGTTAGADSYVMFNIGGFTSVARISGGTASLVTGISANFRVEGHMYSDGTNVFLMGEDTLAVTHQVYKITGGAGVTLSGIPSGKTFINFVMTSDTYLYMVNNTDENIWYSDGTAAFAMLEDARKVVVTGDRIWYINDGTGDLKYAVAGVATLVQAATGALEIVQVKEMGTDYVVSITDFTTPIIYVLDGSVNTVTGLSFAGGSSILSTVISTTKFILIASNTRVYAVDTAVNFAASLIHTGSGGLTSVVLPISSGEGVYSDSSASTTYAWDGTTNTQLSASIYLQPVNFMFELDYDDAFFEGPETSEILAEAGGASEVITYPPYVSTSLSNVGTPYIMWQPAEGTP